MKVGILYINDLFAVNSHLEIKKIYVVGNIFDLEIEARWDDIDNTAYIRVFYNNGDKVPVDDMEFNGFIIKTVDNKEEYIEELKKDKKCRVYTIEEWIAGRYKEDRNWD